MTKRSKQPPPPLPPRREAMLHMDYQSVVSSIEKPASTSPLLGPGLGQECVYVFLVIFSPALVWRELTIPAKRSNIGGGMLLWLN